MACCTQRQIRLKHTATVKARKAATAAANKGIKIQPKKVNPKKVPAKKPPPCKICGK